MPKPRFPFEDLDFNATTLRNGLCNVLQYVESKLRQPGNVTLEEALCEVKRLTRDALFIAEEELAAVPKDDLGEAML